MVDVRHWVLQGLLQRLLLVLEQAQDDAPHETSEQREDREPGLWEEALLYRHLDQAQSYSGQQVEIHLQGMSASVINASQKSATISWLHDIVVYGAYVYRACNKDSRLTRQ